MLAGLSYEPERITAIDVNPVMKELTTERYADYIMSTFRSYKIQ